MMATLADHLFALERRLAEYPGIDADSLLNRRLLLREAFRSYGDDRRKEGYTDGIRDASETRMLAEKLAGEKEGDDGS
jgi:hypothetical protein